MLYVVEPWGCVFFFKEAILCALVCGVSEHELAQIAESFLTYGVTLLCAQLCACKLMWFCGLPSAWAVNKVTTVFLAAYGGFVLSKIQLFAVSRVGFGQGSECEQEVLGG